MSRDYAVFLSVATEPIMTCTQCQQPAPSLTPVYSHDAIVAAQATAQPGAVVNVEPGARLCPTCVAALPKPEPVDLTRRTEAELRAPMTPEQREMFFHVNRGPGAGSRSAYYSGPSRRR